jgi:hypothetical protein
MWPPSRPIWNTIAGSPKEVVMQERFTSCRVTLCLLVLAMATGACGGGAGTTGDGGTATPSQTSGVTGSKTVGSLTAADKQKICDWTASLYGGYGGKVVCDDGSGMIVTIPGPASLTECLAQAAAVPATCTATVVQAETCTRAISTCDESDDAAAMDACTAMFTCVP